MFSDTAIAVENLSKCYHIYDKPRDRLKQFVFPPVQHLFGRRTRSYFREFWALKDVSFEVKKGETVGIVGRNGSGKSTLLQMICGTLNPTEGTIRANGRVAALLELGSGFNPEFTGRENVFLNASVLGLSIDEIEKRFDSIAAFADIGEFVDQPVKNYSSGMVVRLAFAVAINVDPEVLVVDEALSVGDELFQRKCFSRIAAIKESGSTILFVSHSGGTVVEFCDRAILLDSGEQLAIGAPKIIIGKYQKLLYAPQHKRLEIRDEVRSSGREPEIEAESTEQTSMSPTASKPVTVVETDEFFDGNLKPVSTIAYESHGACIESAEILNLSGLKVNCLKRGNTYRYIYTVRFTEGATSVRFGMMIKTISGLELGGAVSAPGMAQAISCVMPNTSARIEFSFVCTLNPGTYFLNAGVTGVRRDEEIYLHRMLDLHMFKVLPCMRDTATGMVDFRCVANVEFVSATDQVAAYK